MSSDTSVVELGDSVFAFANFLRATADVRQLVISQMYFRDTATCQLFLLTLILKTGCMPIINICRRMQFV